MNLVVNGSVRVLIDYAHNAPAMRALAELVRSWDGETCRVVGMAGDRRREGYLDFGRTCAETFDRVIVREDSKARGRQPREVPAMIVAGLEQASLDCKFEIVPGEPCALERALEIAPPVCS